MFKKLVVVMAIFATSGTSFGQSPLSKDETNACGAILCLVPPGPGKSECRHYLIEYFAQGIRNVFKPSLSSIKRARKNFLKICPNKDKDAHSLADSLVENNMRPEDIAATQNQPVYQYYCEEEKERSGVNSEAYGRCVYTHGTTDPLP